MRTVRGNFAYEITESYTGPFGERRRYCYTVSKLIPQEILLVGERRQLTEAVADAEEYMRMAASASRRTTGETTD